MERFELISMLKQPTDERIVMPMLGFTRSFNISVAAALCLYHIVDDRRARLGGHGDLSEEEKLCLTASYYRRSVQNADAILLERRREG